MSTVRSIAKLAILLLAQSTHAALLQSYPSVTIDSNSGILGDVDYSIEATATGLLFESGYVGGDADTTITPTGAFPDGAVYVEFTYVNGATTWRLGCQTVTRFVDYLTTGECAKVIENFGTTDTVRDQAYLFANFPLNYPMNSISDYEEYDEVPSAGVNGDPHLVFAHGGRADFRGRNGGVFNFLTANGLALNVRIQEADFKMNEGALLVHGTFITEAHIVHRDVANGATVRLSMWTQEISERNFGWHALNVSCSDSDRWRYIFPHKQRACPGSKFRVGVDYSTANVLVANQWDIRISSRPVYNWVAGPKHRLDIRLMPLSRDLSNVHGILGQGFFGPKREGKRDEYPDSGEFTTSAMAEGCIDGVWSDYEVNGAYETNYKFSRFDAADENVLTIEHLEAAESFFEFEAPVNA